MQRLSLYLSVKYWVIWVVWECVNNSCDLQSGDVSARELTQQEQGVKLAGCLLTARNLAQSRYAIIHMSQEYDLAEQHGVFITSM